MAKTFLLEVVSPESIVWSGRAEMLVTRTTEGEIGILADHEPTMAALSTGSSVITAEGGERVTLAIHGGFLQILRNEVTLLTDRAEIVEGDRAAAAELAQSLAEAGDSAG
ncbi:MAG: F0F1 ATP synthase subunit epsilon [Actinobacteria bacterium]|nr:F0F1 ATP synthase subunit epsilon [Actinomycetota bacterium]MBU1493837.1 F0F1 ATP synthase subunit epsilon [Actinomycetota bacterium]MBU1866522.1 F0F1 ATP synthase subunit epsilon [Actinomycetota bacterium]